jgi:hypothetical protein
MQEHQHAELQLRKSVYGYAITGFLMELYFKKFNDDPAIQYLGNVNIKQRNTFLGIGIGLLSFGFAIGKIGNDLRDLSIEKYNESLTDSSYKSQLKEVASQGFIKRPDLRLQENQQQAPSAPQPEQQAPAQDMQQPTQQNQEQVAPKEELSSEPTHEIK